MPQGNPRDDTTYRQLMEALRAIWQETENRTKPTLKEGRELSKQRLGQLGDLSREELDKVSAYLQRDLRDAADFLQQSGKTVGDWLKHDLEFAEYKFADLFADLAETTRDKLDEIAERAHKVNEWHAGEVTGVGILKCQNCGEKIHLRNPGYIPPCPKCQGTFFKKSFSDHSA